MRRDYAYLFAKTCVAAALAHLPVQLAFALFNLGAKTLFRGMVAGLPARERARRTRRGRRLVRAGWCWIACVGLFYSWFSLSYSVSVPAARAAEWVSGFWLCLLFGLLVVSPMMLVVRTVIIYQIKNRSLLCCFLVVLFPLLLDADLAGGASVDSLDAATPDGADGDLARVYDNIEEAGAPVAVLDAQWRMAQNRPGVLDREIEGEAKEGQEAMDDEGRGQAAEMHAEAPHRAISRAASTVSRAVSRVANAVSTASGAETIASKISSAINKTLSKIFRKESVEVPPPPTKAAGVEPTSFKSEPDSLRVTKRPSWKDTKAHVLVHMDPDQNKNRRGWGTHVKKIEI